MAAPAPRRPPPPEGLRLTLRLLRAWWRDRGQFSSPRLPRHCPICDYRGVFISVGHPPRWDARCPGCGSRERHRLTELWITEGGADRFAGKRILHFAPEKVWQRRMAGQPLYETADLLQKGVTHQVDITKIPLPDAGYDIVMAHHVLEHIPDDRAAMAELFRMLKPGGIGVFSVPINPTRRETYENPAITRAVARAAHFSAPDHVRYYGLDFADRLEACGFRTEIFRLPPEREVEFGLLRDEWLYIATKPGA
ncbi:MAG: class I SAM-dependent methyltransferase [Rhodospirillales bacterium]|nr:class I SAM-dependent methyltransferase [Rhodospirillales bacterium]